MARLYNDRARGLDRVAARAIATVGEVLAPPGIVERVLRDRVTHEPMRPPGRDREQLLALLS